METHRQLGLPPCTFKEMTGLPCPSCGMTSSFALLVRGDVMNSLRANAVGTLARPRVGCRHSLAADLRTDGPAMGQGSHGAGAALA